MIIRSSRRLHCHSVFDNSDGSYLIETRHTDIKYRLLEMLTLHSTTTSLHLSILEPCYTSVMLDAAGELTQFYSRPESSQGTTPKNPSRTQHP